MTTYTAYFNRFTIELTAEQMTACSHPGPCDDDVEETVKELDLTQIQPDDLRAELKDYGAWDDDELQDHAANLRRIVWIAAGNIKDDIRTMEEESAQ